MTSIALYFTVIDQSHLQIGKSIEGSLWSILVITNIRKIHVDAFTNPGSLFGPCAVSNFGKNFWSAYIPMLVGELSTLHQHHKELLTHSRMPLPVMMFLILTKALLAMRTDSGRIFSGTLRQIVRDGTRSPDIKWKNFTNKVYMRQELLTMWGSTVSSDSISDFFLIGNVP